MKLAIIGSGISGLSAAYYLSKNLKVDLFEKEDHFGGHSHTIDIKIQDNVIPVDIGFIVFNKKTYPNLINYFEENNIAIDKSNMSFSVSVRDSEIEYCGKGLSGIPGLIGGIILGIGFSSYVFAMYNTTVANTNFIIQTQTIFLAIFGYFF